MPSHVSCEKNIYWGNINPTNSTVSGIFMQTMYMRGLCQVHIRNVASVFVKLALLR